MRSRSRSDFVLVDVKLLPNGPRNSLDDVPITFVVVEPDNDARRLIAVIRHFHLQRGIVAYINRLDCVFEWIILVNMNDFLSNFLEVNRCHRGNHVESGSCSYGHVLVAWSVADLAITDKLGRIIGAVLLEDANCASWKSNSHAVILRVKERYLGLKFELILPLATGIY